MKNYELFGNESAEECAVRMIISYAIDNYEEYSDDDVDELHRRYLENKKWASGEVRE